MTCDCSNFGFKLPAQTPVTANELEWIQFLRLITNDADPAPSLAHVQSLRLLMQGRVASAP
jgi:hypothetical protein